MLQYAAAPNAHQNFQRPPAAFADQTSRVQTGGSGVNSYNIPRPPSQHYDGQHHPLLGGIELVPSSQVPALSALASVAANARAMNPPLSTSGESTRSSTPSNAGNMSNSSQLAPSATAGGSTQASPPVCANCQTSTTPLWRRDEGGSVLCNACGLFLKLHGRPRPISLKTDVIKSRNRVKTTQPKKRDSQAGHDGFIQPAPNGYSGVHPEPSLNHAGVHISHGFSVAGDSSQRLPSPAVSRSNTPAVGHQSQSIAPPHIFDAVTLPSDSFASPNLPPSFAMRQPSPAPSSLNGTQAHLETIQSYESIAGQNSALRTRVSELEVINDLFRGRVSELEASEQDARRNERIKAEEVRRLNEGLQAANSRAADLERRLAELESEGPARKKARMETHLGESSGDQSGNAA